MIDDLYYIYSLMNIIWVYVYIKDCLNIYIYSCLGGWLGSLLLRIEPRGLYPWDIFSCLMGVSIIDIKVCTFSIGVNFFMISSIDSHGYSWFWGISSFSTQILSITLCTY